MVTKRLLAEQVINLLNKGIVNKDSNITIRQAMAVVGEVRNRLIKQELWDRYANFGSFDVPESVLSEYTVETEYNEERDFWYLTLPVGVLSLNHDLGIYNVSTACDNAYPFIKLPSSFKSLYRDLPSSSLEGRKGYIARGRELRLQGVSECLKIDLVLVVDGVDLSPSEDFKFIAERQNELIAMSVDILKYQVGIQDTNENNNER
jgi:hypothetical protein